MGSLRLQLGRTLLTLGPVLYCSRILVWRKDLVRNFSKIEKRFQIYGDFELHFFGKVFGWERKCSRAKSFKVLWLRASQEQRVVSALWRWALQSDRLGTVGTRPCFSEAHQESKSFVSLADRPELIVQAYLGFTSSLYLPPDSSLLSF